jgi:hypothetical protein
LDDRDQTESVITIDRNSQGRAANQSNRRKQAAVFPTFEFEWKLDASATLGLCDAPNSLAQ